MLHSSYRLLKFKAKLVSFSILFLFAIYVLIGRTILVVLPDYQQDIERILSEQIQMPVEISSVSGRWVGFDPVIDINGLSVNGVENAYIGRARIRLAFLASLYALAPRFKSIVVEHSEFTIFQDVGGAWKVAGFELSEKEGGSEAEFTSINTILNGAAITLVDNTVLLRHKQGKVQMLRSPMINLRYLNDNVFASGTVLQEEGQKTLLNFSVEGSGVLTDKNIAGVLYLEARSAEFFDRVLKTYQWQRVAIQDIDASARLWLEFDGFNVTSIQGDAQISELNWIVAEKSVPPIINAIVDVKLTSSKNKQLLSLSGLNFNWAGQACDSSDIQITSQALELEVRASQLNIKCISQLASVMGVLPKTLQDRLDVSLPEGKLKNIKLTLRENDSTVKNILVETLDINANSHKKQLPALSVERFNFEAELENVSLDAYEGSPSVKGVDGYVHADTKGGAVYFDSQRFELGFPDLFTNSWKMKRTEGKVSWLVEDDDVLVVSEGLRLYQMDDSLVYGDFLLRLNPIEREDYLSLSLGMQDIPFKNASSFVPGLVVGEDLNEWLDSSLVSGAVSEGIYVGYGSIESDSPDNSFTSSVYLKTAQGKLSFSEEWPLLENLNADVQLQNGELVVQANRAKINETELLDVYAEIPETSIDETDHLKVRAAIKANKKDLGYWLADSPISSHTEKVLDQLEIEGEINVNVTLDIPLSDDQDVGYFIENDLNGVTVNHPETGLSFNDVRGVLEVSNLNGVMAKDVSAEFLGQKSSINISTHSAKHSNSDMIQGVDGENTGQSSANTVISVDSEAPVADLFHYLDQKALIGLGGSLTYRAELKIPTEGDELPALKVSSDLVGLSYDSPAPFNKSAKEKRNLEVNALIDPEALNLNISLLSESSPEVKSKLLFLKNEFVSGEVLVGDAESKAGNVKGLSISAKLAHVQLQPWVDFIQQNINDTDEAESNVLKRIDLEINDLDAFGQNFRSTQAIVTKPKEAWQIGLSGESIQGKVLFPTENTMLDVQLDHLFLTSDVKNQQTSESKVLSENESDALDPRKIPEIKFATKKLVKDDVNYGEWKARALPNEQGVVFKGIKGKIDGTSFDGQLNWKLDDTVQGKNAHTSILTMDIKGEKFEALLEAIGKDPLVSSEQFDSNVSLVWSGTPPDFKLAKVSGSILLKMENGFLNTEDAKTGALRVFGILNAESIMRRLKLDFSDLYKSGVGYDVFSVKTTINRGLLTFTEPLVIDGPSSSYLINGSVNLRKETLDMDMLVKLPVVQNLPLAALILGAPQIGGAVWVVDKLLGEPLSAITTARYDITGSWEKPDVKLNKAMNASKKDRSKQNH